MPRLIHKTPAYRKHRATGQAIVVLDGRTFYMGPHGTAASRAEYDRLTGEWLAGGRRLPGARDAITDLRIIELLDRFWTFAQGHYGGSTNNGELGAYRAAIKLLKNVYGDTPIAEFGPASLVAVRQAMIVADWSRGFINRQLGRVRRIFRWGVASELVPVEVLQRIATVEGLRRGKTKARETAAVKPAPDAQIDAIQLHTSRQVWAMTSLQRLTGMRPGEVCIMRACDLDTTGRLWVYRPAKHKTEHHGHERVIYLGKRAQAIIQPFLGTNLQAYLFSPRAAEIERRERLHKARKTPLDQGNVPAVDRDEDDGSHCYSVNSYRRAIKHACECVWPMPPHLAHQRVAGAGRKIKSTRFETQAEWKSRLGKERWAELTKWRREHRFHPHQLRHSAATWLRKEFGLEAAQVILGHRTLSVTQLYAEKNVEAAMKIMGEVG